MTVLTSSFQDWITRQSPPRPGLVPKSGDWNAPDRWILPHETEHSKRQKIRQEAKEWLIEKFPQKDFTLEEKKALTAYITGVSYISINNALRSNAAWPRPSVVEGLDSLFHKAMTSEDIVVYRGLQTYDGDLQSGDILYDKGFVSTSIVRSIAEVFSASGASNKFLILEIFVPKNSPATRGELHELEVVLPRDSEFIVENVHVHPDRSNTTIVRVRMKAKNA